MDKGLICIRRMTESDVDAAAELETICFSQPWTAQGFLDALKQEQNIFLVAEDASGYVAGYLGLYGSFDEGEITNVAVHPDFRKMGLGYALVSKAKEEAYQQGIRDIYLEVRATNENVKLLYNKAGFESCGIRKNFYEKPKEDAIVMHVSMQ